MTVETTLSEMTSDRKLAHNNGLESQMDFCNGTVTEVDTHDYLR